MASKSFQHNNAVGRSGPWRIAAATLLLSLIFDSHEMIPPGSVKNSSIKNSSESFVDTKELH